MTSAHYVLDHALALTPRDDVLEATIDGAWSNGPLGMDPARGGPFGGLMAALAARAMRDGLELKPPLRSLSVQFLAGARFGEPVGFRPRLLRGGRRVVYSAVEAEEGGRPVLHATATWGPDETARVVRPLDAPPPPLASLDPGRTISGPTAPHFSQHVDYVFADGPDIMGGRDDAPPQRLWMRLKDGRPLDDLGLCFLLDALYPPAWTTASRPIPMSSVDLRYDIVETPTPQRAPDGWAFFDFRLLDLGLGWTMDEATCWGADGRLLALSRQRRKLLPDRPPRG